MRRGFRMPQMLHRGYTVTCSISRIIPDYTQLPQCVGFSLVCTRFHGVMNYLKEHLTWRRIRRNPRLTPVHAGPANTAHTTLFRIYHSRLCLLQNCDSPCKASQVGNIRLLHTTQCTQACVVTMATKNYICTILYTSGCFQTFQFFHARETEDNDGLGFTVICVHSQGCVLCNVIEDTTAMGIRCINSLPCHPACHPVSG